MATAALLEETDTQRYTRIFREGYRACRAGKSNIDSPYTEDGDAEAWNEGWMERCDDEAEAAEMGDFE